MTGLVPLEAPVGDLSLAEWIDTFEHLARASAQIAVTAFVPATLRAYDERGNYDASTTAAQVASAILTGAELGLRPMAALRAINVISATPAMTALALRAVLQSKGHHVQLVEANGEHATVRGWRVDEAEAQAQSITWRLQDARDRNLAGKVNWRTQPRNMLIARATAEVCRLVAADAILGVPYALEEIDDGDLWPQTGTVDGAGAEAGTGNGAAPPTRRRRRRTAETPPQLETAAATSTTAPAEDDPLNEPSPAEVRPTYAAPATTEAPRPTPATEPPITPAQVRGIQAQFRGVARGERLHILGEILGHPVASLNDLTAAEASRAFDEIKVRRARAESGTTRPNTAEAAEGGEVPDATGTARPTSPPEGEAPAEESGQGRFE